jgi:hypothetical protein
LKDGKIWGMMGKGASGNSQKRGKSGPEVLLGLMIVCPEGA